MHVIRKNELDRILNSEASSLISFLREIYLDYNSVIYWEKLLSYILEKSQKFLNIHSIYILILEETFINFYVFSENEIDADKDKTILQIRNRLKDYNLPLTKSLKKLKDEELLAISSYKFIPLTLADTNLAKNQKVNTKDMQTVVGELLSNKIIAINYINEKDNALKCSINSKITANFLFAVIAIVINSVLNLNTTLEELHLKASTDPLTNAYNKIILETSVKNEIEKLQKECTPSKIFSLAFIDIDNLKAVNDIYGHQKGDEILKKFVEISKLLIRKSDLIARVGGDEFVIMFSSCSSEAAKKVLYQIKEQYMKETDSTFTAAIVEWPTHGENYEELYNYSDQLLLNLKQTKKGCIITSRETIKNKKTTVISKDEPLREIENYLKFENIIPYYQGIYDVSKETKKLVGYEVLMRFTQNNLFSANVEKYICFLEETGKISIAGKILMEKALKNISEYYKNGNANTFFTLNFSPQELIDGRYISWFLSIIKKLNLTDKNLFIELTERGANIDSYLLIKNAKIMRENKLKLGLDDFGKVYSSFCQLCFLRIDFIKLDRSLVIEAMKNTKILLFIESLRRYCVANNIILSAEGVETKEILDFIKTLEIKYAQGFYLGLPSNKLI